jgi:hypothetical protein
MDVLKEQRVCIKFCEKLGETATETYEMLQQAFGETALSRSKTSEWYSRFKNGSTSIDDDPSFQMQFVGNGLTNGPPVPGFCTTTMRHAMRP